MTTDSPEPEPLPIHDHTIDVELDTGTYPVVDSGDGEPMLLLHGFPDSRHLWRFQIPALLEADYRVIAPDLKGFGEAPKPQDVEAYDLFKIGEEVLALLDHLGIDRTNIVGHDWGAALTWVLTAFNQERVTKMAALSVGAPGVPAQFTLGQFQRSWYVQFFCDENAEAWLLRNNGEMLRQFLRMSPDSDRYLERLTRRDELTAALNWYRANWEIPHPDDAEIMLPTINRPVMGVWSEGDDVALKEEWMKQSSQVVGGPWRYERITDTSHWMMLDKPGRINDLLLDFLKET